MATDPRNCRDPVEWAWYQSPQRIPWTLFQTIDAADLATTCYPPGYLWQYIWMSPTFDLRPDLGTTQNALINAVPIWQKSARFYMQLVADAAGTGVQPVLATDNFNVRAVDFINTTLNNQTSGSTLEQMPPIEVSHNFAVISPATTAIATFVPPGNVAGYSDGNPIRYWRLRLTFRFMVETVMPLPGQTDPPNFGFWAGMY